jgi:hypothetical protein
VGPFDDVGELVAHRTDLGEKAFTERREAHTAAGPVQKLPTELVLQPA